MLLILPRPHGTWWREMELFELTFWVRAITHPTAWSAANFMSLWSDEVWQDSKGWSELPASTHLFHMFRHSLATVVTKLHTWPCTVGVRFPGRTKIYLSPQHPARLWGPAGPYLTCAGNFQPGRNPSGASTYLTQMRLATERLNFPLTHTSKLQYLIKPKVHFLFRLDVDYVSPDWTFKKSAFFPRGVCLFVSCDAEKQQYPFGPCKDLSAFSIR